MNSSRFKRKIISHIRAAIQSGNFFFTWHCANESMPDDKLTASDVVNALLHGYLDRILINDLSGERYAIVGRTTDNRCIETLCRFNKFEKLVIITTYEVQIEK